VLIAVAVAGLVYVISDPPNPALGVTGGVAAGALLLGLGTFLYGRSGLDVSLGGVVVRDVPKVRLTARVNGPRPIKPVDVLIKSKAGEWVSAWDRDADYKGLGDVLGHAGELIVDFRRDRLVAETGEDWPRHVRIVDNFGAAHERTFNKRVA
jgi:hypothetical protein